MLVKIFLYYILIHSLNLIHELGHYIFFKICFKKIESISITLGLGKNLFKTDFLTVKILPIGAVVFTQIDDDYYSKQGKFSKILPILAGPISNLLLFILAAYFLKGMDPSTHSNILIDLVSFTKYYCLYTFLFAIVPMRYLNLSSDGLSILNIIRDPNPAEGK